MRVLHVLPHRGGGAETYLDLLERLEGVEHARLELADARRPLAAAPSIARSLRRLHRAAQGADLVHAHGDVAAMLALPVRPRIWTTHGLHLLRRAPWVRPGVRASVGCADLTLCCSVAERDELAAFAPREKLRVVPNGVDLPPPRDRPWGGVALFVGELTDRKDPLTAAKAAREAQMPLLVAGDGPLREAVAAEGAEVLGHVEDVGAVMDRADVFVLPSRREGISFAVLEAMARGLAMVVSDAPGNAEAVGDAGIVVPAGDVAAFASALRAATPAHGAAARERVGRQYTVDRLLAGVAAAYGIRAPAPATGGAAA
jgi:glycosyltransferase involved in cell wall biosynthesis